MAFLGTLIAYLDRANLSVAMPDIVKGFKIGPTAEGLILSSFFWTYALFQLPAGRNRAAGLARRWKMMTRMERAMATWAFRLPRRFARRR
jgi:MFS family permease